MKNGVTFTERELDIMSILWQEGSGTVAEVKDELDTATKSTSGGVATTTGARLPDMVPSPSWP